MMTMTDKNNKFTHTINVVKQNNVQVNTESVQCVSIACSEVRKLKSVNNSAEYTRMVKMHMHCIGQTKK